MCFYALRHILQCLHFLTLELIELALFDCPILSLFENQPNYTSLQIYYLGAVVQQRSSQYLFFHLPIQLVLVGRSEEYQRLLML